MQRPPPGRNVTVSTQGEAFAAFIPAPLPPRPPLQWSAALRSRFDEALVALGRLDAISSLLPNAELLLYSDLMEQQVGQRRLRAFDLRRQHRFLAHEATSSPACRSKMPVRSAAASPRWRTGCQGCVAVSH